MHLPGLEHAYFLQSLGMSIVHSFWQAGIFWFFYQIIVKTNKKLPAFIKYNISIVFVFSSFSWFVVTIFQTYFLLLNNQTALKLNYFESWVINFRFIDNTLPYLSIAYLVVLCYYILSFYKNLTFTRLLLNEGSKKAPVDVRLFTNKVAGQMGIKKKIEVWISEHVDVPSVTGFIKPIILLPAAFINQLSIQQTEAVLLHELAHIRRNDYLINILQSAVETVLFFNPFVILIGKTAKKERENCCDDCVIDFQYDRFEYAKALIFLEEQRQLMTENFALTATNGEKNLLQRIKRMFDIYPPDKINASQKVKLATSIAMLFFILFLSCSISVKQNNKEELKNLSEEITSIPTSSGSGPIEKYYKKEFASRPVTPTIKNMAKVITKKQTTKSLIDGPENEYVDAFINQDLLAQTEMIDAISSFVAEKDTPKSTYIVTIEEEQSGKTQNTIYYFELKNNEGETVIKPLIILKKTTKSSKITPLKTSRDSLPETSTRGFKRKRITS